MKKMNLLKCFIYFFEKKAFHSFLHRFPFYCPIYNILVVKLVFALFIHVLMLTFVHLQTTLGWLYANSTVMTRFGPTTPTYLFQ